MRRAAAEIGRLVAVGHVDVAGDEAGGEAEAADRLHHQEREIAAAAAAKVQRRQRRVRAALRAPLVGEALLDAVGEGLQKLAGRGRAPLAQELAHPALELPLGIGIAPLDRGQEIRQLVRLIRERVGLGVFLDLEVGGSRRRVVEPHPALEAQLARLPGEACDRDAVPERVVDPAEMRRLGRDLDLGRDELLVVAVARPEHHAMLAEGDRPAVAIGRDVADRKDRHLASAYTSPRSAHLKRQWRARPVPACGSSARGRRAGRFRSPPCRAACRSAGRRSGRRAPRRRGAPRPSGPRARACPRCS